MFLGIDVGGTTARVTAFDSLTKAEAIGRIEFGICKTPDGYETDYQSLRNSCHSLMRLSRQAVESIGLATAGVVAPDRKSILAASNLSHWVKQPFVDDLSDEFGCPVVLGNDAEAAALADAHYGNTEDQDFWFMIWGTGVGGCLVRRRNGLTLPFPGEVGHQRVMHDSRIPCDCGQTGCLEAYCGGAGIAKRFSVTADKLNHAQWSEVASWMSIGVRNIIAVQPTPLIVFGGGIANKQPQLLNMIEVRLRRELKVFATPEIRLSAFGESAGTIGALALLNLRQ